LLGVLGVADVAPQGFDIDVAELDALLQSIPPELCAPYDGAVIGEAILFVLIAVLDCCCGGIKDGLPIPGLLGAIAGKDELRVPKVLSGVIARLCAFGALRDVLFGGGDTGGVDQENVAAGDALLDDLERLFDGRAGKTVEEDVDADVFAHGSLPIISAPPEGPGCPPRTSASKSASPPFVVSEPFGTLRPPKLMNSLRDVAVEPLAPNSCSLRVCSPSIRDDMDLINVI
jgi:hypothetical protein